MRETETAVIAPPSRHIRTNGPARRNPGARPVSPPVAAPPRTATRSHWPASATSPPGTRPRKRGSSTSNHPFSAFLRLKAALPAACGSAFRRGWEGEGKPESIPWSGPAGKARHTGVSIPVWEREGKALGVPSKEVLRRQALPRAASAAHKNGALARRDADGRCVGKPSARQGCCITDAAPLTRASAQPARARLEER